MSSPRPDAAPEEVLRTGRELLRDLWSFESEEPVQDDNITRSSFQSSVSSAPSTSSTPGDDHERRTFVSLENGISNLDVDFAMAPNGSSIVHQGYLVKRGHNWQTWKKRWFVLTWDGKLEYFKKPNLKKSKGKVDLHDGIVQVHYADVHRVQHAYAFLVVKGYYELLCRCETGAEADAWVRNLRQVRLHRPTEYEGLTHHVGLFSSEAIMTQLLHSNGLIPQILRFQRRVLANASGYTPVSASSILSVQANATSDSGTFTAATILQFIHHLQQTVLTLGSTSIAPENIEGVLGIRCVLEDRVFLPLHDVFYRHLDPVCPPTRVAQQLQTLRALPASGLFDASVLNTDADWSEAIATFSALDTASLPTHKLRIFQRVVDLLPPALASSTHAYRYICVHATVDNLAVQVACLQCVQSNLPLPDLDKPIAALVSAVKWIANFDARAVATIPHTLPAVSVSFSTSELGIQFLPQWPHLDRGARVVGVQKHSQANWSASVQPGLVLVAVNDELVVVWSLLDIVAHIRRAPLPKRLVFMTESDVETLLCTPCLYHLACCAAFRGDLNTLRYLLEICPTMNLHVPSTWRVDAAIVQSPTHASGSNAIPETVLHAAVAGGHIKLVRFLLEDLALSPNQRDNDMSTPLHVMTHNIAEIAPLLVSRGADLNALDRNGRTPLLVQCSKGSKEGVVTLIGLGANLRTQAWSTGMTPLLSCAAAGHTALVDLVLLKDNGTIHDVDHNRDSALHFAAALGHMELIQRLVQGGADMTLANRRGTIPAMVLLQRHANFPSETLLACFRLLTKNRATMRCKDAFGRYVVHFATALESSQMKHVMEWCVEQGANGHVEDIFGDTAKEYKKHPKEHGEYVTPTSYMRHLNVTLVELDAKIRLQNGKVEDIVSYLLADKSTNVSEMMSFLLNFHAYMDITELLAFVKSKVCHPDGAKYSLKHAWSVMAGGSFVRDHHCGAVLFLSLLGVVYPQIVGSDTFQECAHAVETPMASVAQYMAKFQQTYNLSTYSLLEQDLYQHMLELYALKHTPKSFEMKRLAPTASPFEFAKQCTLLAHSLFRRIPIRQLMMPKCQDIGFLAARHWFQHLSSLVTNYILLEDTPSERARVISFFLDVANICFTSLQNFDTFIAIVYALQSTPIFRLKITFSHLEKEYVEKLHKAQTYTQSGSREMNRVMKTVNAPCMPYLGLYLQNIVGLNELPKYEEDSYVNFNRLRMLGNMAQDLMQYQGVTYPFHSNHSMEELIHVVQEYSNEEEIYNRSHTVESKESIEAFVDDSHTSEEETQRDSNLGTSPATSWTSRLRINSNARRRPSTASSQV